MLRAGNVNQNHDDSTRVIYAALPPKSGLEIQTGFAIDDAAVTANREHKLNGSYGETIVIFHDDNSSLGKFIRALQQQMTQHFQLVKQNVGAQCFSADTREGQRATDFAVIENMHTTIIAMHIVDAANETGWNEQIYLEHASHPSLAQLSIDAEHKITSQIHIHPATQLEIESIRLTGNGSLGIKWKVNEDIVALRKSLTGIGGIAKHGLDIITTTIGYFPNCAETCRAEIQAALNKIAQEIKLESPFFLINLEKATLVKFSRNDLHPDYIHTNKLIIDEHITTEIDNTSFPNDLEPVHRLKPF